jgi:hypothetical protein
VALTIKVHVPLRTLAGMEGLGSQDGPHGISGKGALRSLSEFQVEGSFIREFSKTILMASRCESLEW